MGSCIDTILTLAIEPASCTSLQFKSALVLTCYGSLLRLPSLTNSVRTGGGSCGCVQLLLAREELGLQWGEKEKVRIKVAISSRGSDMSGNWWQEMEQRSPVKKCASYHSYLQSIAE